MKIYNKKGNKNYKERRLLRDLEQFFGEKIKEDPSFADRVVPASNYEELQRMHSRYLAEDAEAEIINSNIEQEEKITENMAKRNVDIDEAEVVEETTTKTPKKEFESSSSFVDPFNREEPIVRDYVMGDESLSKNPQQNVEQKTFFDEPTSFDEAFVIPEGGEEEEQSNSGSSQQQKKTPFNAGGNQKQAPREPLNPDFDDMSAGKKKKSTKKFAKYIVEAVATLSEKGFVWYANKDINDSKLTEYEMTGEMDLSLLVTLDGGQEVTVKQFFQEQCMKAEQLAKWTDEQKEDASAALAEVLMEKGVAPTPSQELMLVTLTIIGGQALTMFTLKSQTNALLNQLRAMNGGGEATYEAPYQEPPRQEAPRQEAPTQQEAPSFDEQAFDEIANLQEQIENLTEQEVLISNDEIATKE